MSVGCCVTPAAYWYSYPDVTRWAGGRVRRAGEETDRTRHAATRDTDPHLHVQREVDAELLGAPELADGARGDDAPHLVIVAPVGQSRNRSDRRRLRSGPISHLSSDCGRWVKRSVRSPCQVVSSAAALSLFSHRPPPHGAIRVKLCQVLPPCRPVTLLSSLAARPHRPHRPRRPRRPHRPHRTSHRPRGSRAGAG